MLLLNKITTTAVDNNNGIVNKPKVYNGTTEHLIDHMYEIYGTSSQRNLYTEEQLQRIDIAAAMRISLDHPSDA